MPIRMVFFLTRGLSLRSWERDGLLDREMKLYERLRERGVHVSVVSFGRRGERSYATRYPGIRILSNRWGLKRSRYERLLPFLHWRSLAQADLVKSNQTDGAELAQRAARMWKKPLLARCGYLWPEFVAAERGVHSEDARRALDAERRAFMGATGIAVTTQEMKERVLERLPEVAGRVRILPNYVDTELFHPGRPEVLESPRRVITVARLAPQKNLFALIDAVEALGVSLDIVGEGPLRQELARRVAGNCRIRLLGTLPHPQLPYRLRAAGVFVLPSLYEGHPKALLEAMACGLAVVATDVPGNTSVVRHEETGLLCATSADSLREALGRLLSDAGLGQRLGEQARRFVAAHCALDVVVDRELALYEEIIGAASPGKATQSSL